MQQFVLNVVMCSLVNITLLSVLYINCIKAKNIIDYCSQQYAWKSICVRFLFFYSYIWI